MHDIDNSPSPITWATEALIKQGYELKCPPEAVRVMPWSEVWRFPTMQGSVYLKHMAEPGAVEPVIIRTLTREFSHYLPKVIEENAALRCFLMEDAGVPLRHSLMDHYNVKHVCELLRTYADMQQKMVQHREELLTAGVPDWRLAKLPNLYQQLVKQEDILKADGLTDLEIKALRDLQPQVSDLCEKLASYKIPETLEHNDFHDNNILQKEDHTTFCDWGDATISHPFFSLASFLDSARRHHDIAEGSAYYKELRDAYLESWCDVTSNERLNEAFVLVTQLHPIPLALNFNRTMRDSSIAMNSYKGFVAEALRAWIHKDKGNQTPSLLTSLDSLIEGARF